MLHVNRRGGTVRLRGDAVVNDVADLRNRHVRDNRYSHATELFQSVIQPPQWPQINAEAAQCRHHNQTLHHHTKRGAQTQQQHMRVHHTGEVVLVNTARQQHVQRQHRDGYQVVHHRRPRAGPEHFLGVKHRHEQGEHPVEHDLR